MECYRQIVTICSKTKSAHGVAAKKGKAAAVLAERAALFEKYDKDKDGFLNQREVGLYAKGEFAFLFSTEASAKVLARLANGKAGVPRERFQALRMAVGIAREEEASRERLRAAEERR